MQPTFRVTFARGGGIRGRSRLKVAIVHDWLNQVGGAEAVLEALKELFPDAPVYTSIYWPEKMPE